jgi:hypothetical protein
MQSAQCTHGKIVSLNGKMSIVAWDAHDAEHTTCLVALLATQLDQKQGVSVLRTCCDQSATTSKTRYQALSPESTRAYLPRLDVAFAQGQEPERALLDVLFIRCPSHFPCQGHCPLLNFPGVVCWAA